MASVNRVLLVGHLGRDPELRTTTNGTSVCEFSVATNERWKDQQGNPQEKTDWHRIVVWGRQAENVARYLSKGSQALIEGKLQTRDYTDKEGNKRYITEVVAQNVQFLDTRGGGGGGGGGNDRPPAYEPPAMEPSSGGGSFSDDDIPF